MSSLPPFLSPSLEEYPDYHPPKVPAWRRRWVQVTTASLVAFLVGIGVGGAGQATASPEQSGKVQRLTASLKDARSDAADVKDELADAQSEQERLR